MQTIDAIHAEAINKILEEVAMQTAGCVDDGFDQIEDIIMILMEEAYQRGTADANCHHETLKFEEIGGRLE